MPMASGGGNAGAPGGPVFTLGTGPSGSSSRTVSALARPVLHHLDPEFLALYAGAVELLHRALGGELAPVVLQGEAVLGLEAAVAALTRERDVVLCLVSGDFARGLGDWARPRAREVVELEVPDGQVIDPERVRHALRERPEISLVLAVHCETVAGTVNPMGAIGEVVAEAGATLLVDAIASFAGMPVDPAGWRAGVVVAGSEKCLGGPPGLSLLYVSQQAWERIEANPAAPRGSFLSLLDWRDAHLPDRAFPFAPSVSDVYALHACLEQYLEEGEAAAWERHRRVARAARAGARALGLSLWPREETTCADTVTVLRLPPGIDGELLLRQARSELGVLLTGGQGSLAGQVVRIGHMGPSAFPLAPVLALAALGRGLRAQGFPAQLGAAVEAALEAL